ncbi:MAG: c-type cytochrome [Acidimicrobiales bacterium]
MAENRKSTRRDAARRAQRRRWMLIGAPVVLVAAVVAAALLLGGGEEADAPVAGSAEQLALGEEVFVANCATCHGEGAQGGLAGPPLVHEIYEPDHHPDSAFRAAVANGVTPHHWDFAGMPPIQGLSDDDVDAVIAYVRERQQEAWGGPRP